MKAVLNETKRILAVMLSVAMIIAAVPQVAFANPSDNSAEEPVIDETAVQEDVAADTAANAVEDTDGGESGESGGEDVNPALDSDADVQIQMNVTQVPTTGHINFGKAEAGDTPAVLALTHEADDTQDDSTAFVRVYQDADSDGSYSFYVIADAGYAFPENLFKTVEYTDFKQNTKATKGTAPKIAIEKGTGEYNYQVEDVTPTLKKVTFPSTLLKKVIERSEYKDGATVDDGGYDTAQIRVTVDKTTTALTRLLEKPTLTSDLTPAATWPESLRKVTYVGTVADGDNVTIQGLNAYVTNKTLSPSMIKVIYKAPNLDAVTLTAADGDGTTIKNNVAITEDNQDVLVQYKASEDSGNGQLHIAALLSDAFVNQNADLTISIDGASADENVKTVTVAPNSYATVLESGKDTELNGKTYDSSKDFKFDVKVGTKAGTGRTVRSILVKENTDGTEFVYNPAAGTTSTGFTAGTAADPKYPFTLTRGNIDDNVTITVVTQETVNTADASTNGGIYDTEGAALTTAESGKTLTFEARPNGGYAVKDGSVKYEIGTGDDKVTGTAVAKGDNKFEIPVAVDKKLFIEAAYEPASAGKKHDVVLNDGNDATNNALKAVVYDGTGTAAADEYKTTTWNKTGVAVRGNYYYFSVKPTAGFAESASYKFGTADPVEAVLVRKEATYNVYRTAERVGDDDITLLVTTQASAKLVYAATPNPRVKLSFKNNTIVDSSKDYDFTVTPVATTDSTIKVDKVGYAYKDSTNADKTGEIPNVNGKYHIDNDILTDAATDITISVTTTETMNTGYMAVFTLAGDDKKNPQLVTTEKDADGRIKKQKLNLIVGKTTNDLTAQFYTDTRVRAAISTPVNTAATEYSKHQGISTATFKKTGDEKITDVVTTTAIKALKTGEDTAAAVLELTANGNTKVYTATLPVNITPSYTNLRLLVTDGSVGVSNGDTLKEPAVTAIMAETATTPVNNTIGKYTAKFTVVGTNEQTKKDEEISTNGSNGITVNWEFDPDNKDDAVINHRMATAANVAYGTAGTSVCVLNKVNSIFVRGNKAHTSPVTVKAVVKYDGKDHDPADDLTASINVIDEDTYLPFGTLKVKNGATTAGSTALTDPFATNLELVAGGMTEAELQYDVYKKVIKGALTTLDIGTEDKLKKSIAYAEVEKVVNDVDWVATVVNGVTDDKTDYVNVVNGGNGKFTIKALKKTPSAAPTNVTVSAKVNGVVVAKETLAVTIVNAAAHGTVFLKINDEGATTKVENVDTITQQSLKDTYINGRKHSIVEKNNNNTLTDRKEWGIKFTDEPVSTTPRFVLPTQEDYVQTGLGKNRVLIGWTKNTNYANLYDASTTYYYPGQAVPVADGDFYTAIWMDKYSLPSADFAKKTGNKVEGKVIYSGNEPIKNDPVDKEKITGYQPLTTVASSGTIGLVMNLKERKALTKQATIVAANGLKDDAIGTVNPNAKIVSDVFILPDDQGVLGSTKNDGTDIFEFNKGNLSVKTGITSPIASVPLILTYSGLEATAGVVFESTRNVAVAKDPGYELKVNNNEEKTLIADQMSNNIVTAVLTVGGTQVADGDEKNYAWEWSVVDKTIATIEGGKDTTTIHQLNVGTITPLKAGTTNAQLKVTDKMGISKTATCTIKVTANPVTLTIEDAEHNAPQVNADGLMVIPARVNSTEATDFAISASESVTWSDTLAAGDYDGKVVTAASIDSNSKITLTTSGLTPAGVTGGNELSDKGWVIVKYTYGGKTYGRKLAVSTYYKVNLDITTDGRKKDGSAAGFRTAKQYITKNGKKVTAADGTTHVNSEARVTVANQVITPDPTNPENRGADTYTYENVSLEAFGGVDETTVSPTEFSGWCKEKFFDGYVSTTKDDEIKKKNDFTTAITEKLKATSTDGTNTLVSGNYKLAARFVKQTIKKVTIAQNTITLRNEVDAKLLPTEINSKTINMTVEPYDSTSELDIVPDKSQIYTSIKSKAAPAAARIGYTTATGGALPGAAELTIADGKYTLPFGTDQTYTAHDGATYVETNEKKRHDNFNVAAITGTTAVRRAGTVVFDIQSNGKTVETVTVNINGYDSKDNCYYENGQVVKNDGRKVTDEMWYFDAEGKRITGNKIITKADGTKIAIVDGLLASKGKAVIDGNTYYVGDNGVLQTGWITDAGNTYYADPDDNGKVVVNTIKKVDNINYYFDASGKLAKASSTANLYEKYGTTDYYTNAAGEVAMNGLFKVDGKDRLFREDGTIVVHTDKDVVNGKIIVGGIGYVIADDDTAKRDDILYNPVVKWTPSKFDSKWKKTDALPKFTYTVTVTSKNTGKEQTTDGTAVEAKVVKTTSENGVEKITLAVEANLAGYFVDEEGKTPATVENTKNAKLEETYVFKNGSEEGKKEGSGEVPEDAEAESEPEKSDKANYNSYNLFFTDLVIPVDGLSEALASEGATQTGTWTGFYTVDESGNVVPKSGMSAKEAKNAVKAANSTITVTTTAGLFTYQLPVYYQKPTLQLSSKSATIKNGAETTVTTIVKQKKSNGDYEPIAVNADEGDGREVTYAAKKGNLKSWANGENDGEIAITADQAVNGNLVVKKTNWREDVKLSYKVTAKNTDVLVADKKIVKLNLNGKTEQGQLVTFTLNGADDLTGVTVTTPKKWSDAGVEMEGVAEDGTVSNEVTFKFTEGASHKKGNYSVVFKSPDKKSKATVKVSVTNTELNNAVTLKVKSKIDLTTGQKMVLIPTLNGIGGPIEEISLPGELGTFGASDYNAATNQVVVSALNPASLNTKDNYDLTFNVQAAGEEFTAKVSFKVTAKKPTVKIANVKFPNTLGSAELEGATNVLSTYKYGGKTFSTEPVEVKFTNGAAVEGEEGWFTDSNTGAKVSYDAESGRILIKTASGAKAGTVKVSLKYAGQAKAINKTFKIQKAK